MKRTHKILCSFGGLLALYGLYELLPEGPPRVHGAPREMETVAYEPAAGPALHVLVVGDTGWGNEAEHLTTAAMAADAEREAPDFVLMLGDNFYPHGVVSADDPLWHKAFVEPFDHASLDVPFYPLLGNHDYVGDPSVQIGWDGDPRWRMPSEYHAFERTVGQTVVQFILLDTMGLVYPELELRARQLEWLRATLSASAPDWRIVLGHHPLRTGGRHGVNEELVEHLEPLLLDGDVDLYMAGHEHHLAWMQLDSGLPQLISGAGSRPREVDWTDESVSAFVELGYARVRVEPARIWVQLVSATERSVLSTHVIDARR